MINFPQLEEKILKFWQKEEIFAKSIEQRKGRPIFSFYDGPPFASGLPHYGHILATTIKDAVLRYWTMRGYQVPRRVGWDCHGLPVEHLIEKELGLKSKKDIEKLGIEKFNQACRASVLHCAADWEKTLKRVGRWADYTNAYTTMDSDYIESVWWVFKQLWAQGLVYQDYRVTPYCPRCGTSLSNFEVNQGYQEVEDPSVYIKFQIYKGSPRAALAKQGCPRAALVLGGRKEGWSPNSSFLVWTTTPWTLPGNVALAVHPQEDYLEVEIGTKEHLILAKKRLDVLGQNYKVIRQIQGKDLIGTLYQPLYQFSQLDKSAHRVIEADFVSMEDGTGIVHIAPAFGEEDMEIGKKNNLPILLNVDLEGRFTKEVAPWAGLFIKEADTKIIQNLEKRGLVYKEEKIRHTYPFCWRCDSPLLYYALNSWYIAVTKIKDQLIKNNQKIHWVPGHLKMGRFGQWLEGAKDWAVSRSRFWGAAIPVWLCQTGKFKIQNPKSKINSKLKTQNSKHCDNIKVVGSIQELEKQGGKRIKDLHRPYIDEITFKCEKCGGLMKRIPEVFDCWFESGAMPYAQWHYPFEHKKLVEKTFPADFIAEGLDQTRGWFYTLHVLATALTQKDIGLGKNQPAFKNVIVNGLILDETGKKLSKKTRNYVPPEDIFQRYGADALRYFLLSSTPMGEGYLFSDKKVEEIWRRIISTLWNTYIFFSTYVEKKTTSNFKPQTSNLNLLDSWIISRFNELNYQLVQLMDKYELTKACRLFDDFIDDLSNWYVRRSRRRFQKPESQKDKDRASATLAYILLNLVKLIAPFTPFIAEEIYRNLIGVAKLVSPRSSEAKLRVIAEPHSATPKFPISVHLCDYPKPAKKLINQKLNEQMRLVRQIVTESLAQRAKAGIKVRQPLAELRIKNKELSKNKEFLDLIKDEVNVKEVVFGQDIKLETKITPKLKEEGLIRDLVRYIQEMRKDAGLKPKHQIYLRYSTGPILRKTIRKWQDYIKKETSATSIEAGPKRKEVFLVERELRLANQKLWLGLKKA